MCKIESKLMVRDVSTRWNSTTSLIACARDLRKALNLLVIKAEHNKPRGVRLQRYQLSEAEWRLLDELYPLLEVRISFLLPFRRELMSSTKVFLTATKLVSTNQVPLIHDVIPVIDI